MRPFKVALVDLFSLTGNVVPGWVQQALNADGIELAARDCKSREDLEACASDCDLVWVWGSYVIAADRLDILKKCGAILRAGSGTDNVPVAEASKRNILVVNTPRAVVHEISDHAIALLLSVVRQTAAQDRTLRSGVWEFRRQNNRWHLRGSTLGIVGFGHIGQLVAEKMSIFAVRLLVHDPWMHPAQIRAKGAESVDFRTVLSQSDFISLHCPLTPATRHLVGEKEFQLMKPHAILVNTSRGPVVDENALIRALQEKRIGGAGLDVYEQEPLPSGSPLLQLENVVLTPHIAGYSDLFEESFLRYSVESLIAIANGEWPRSVVNPEVQPKWPLRRREWPPEPAAYGVSEEVRGD